jgi:hypothetical protein
MPDRLFTSSVCFLPNQARVVIVSSGSSSEQPPAEPVVQSEGSAEVTSASDGPFQDRLTAILEQILSASEENRNAVSDPCKAELLAVAAKYPSHDFCSDPILLELIQAITRRMKGLSENRLMAMERSVAASLLDDQESHRRLQHLWEQLKRLVSHGH